MATYCVLFIYFLKYTFCKKKFKTGLTAYSHPVFHTNRSLKKNKPLLL